MTCLPLVIIYIAEYAVILFNKQGQKKTHSGRQKNQVKVEWSSLTRLNEHQPGHKWAFTSSQSFNGTLIINKEGAIMMDIQQYSALMKLN